tara:strand:+ start:525 stop:656 length:132 start_codon:yes stop_codon:yes gene_type:complete
MKIYARDNIKIGKTELIKIFPNFEFGKKISINQKGMTPIFNHR